MVFFFDFSTLLTFFQFQCSPYYDHLIRHRFLILFSLPALTFVGLKRTEGKNIIIAEICKNLSIYIPWIKYSEKWKINVHFKSEPKLFIVQKK